MQGPLWQVARLGPNPPTPEWESCGLLKFYSAEDATPRTFQNASSVTAELRRAQSGRKVRASLLGAPTQEAAPGRQPRLAAPDSGGSARQTAQARGCCHQQITPGRSLSLPDLGASGTSVGNNLHRLKAAM